MKTLNPQDPYLSFIVSASAGSGKTYQLARRFLFLVGAGAAPHTILTVTFTKKAAGEMRGRILEEASRLLASQEERDKFTAALHDLRKQHAGTPLPPPRTAEATAKAILAASQVLRISTIDSLFLEWVSKFPYEASALAAALGESGEAREFPAPLTLVDPSREGELARLAWRAACRLVARGLERGDPSAAEVIRLTEAGGIAAAEPKLMALDRMETYLWHAEVEAGGAGAFRPHLGTDVPEEAEAAFVASIAQDVRAIAAIISNDEVRLRANAALAAGNLGELIQSGLIAKTTLGISGTVLRGKKRDQVAAEIARTDAAVKGFLNRGRLARLDTEGTVLYGLYRAFRDLRDQLKLAPGLVEFRDLAKGCYRLFRGDAGLGVRFLVARTVQHVMLDEFQDTSRLQWAIFAELAAQLTAGDGAAPDSSLPPTVFIVGDEKQSIYGFREADPTVLGAARDALAGRLAIAPLNDSFRTAQVVLDAVNAAFANGRIPEFPPHRTAAPEGRPFVPDTGRVAVLPLAATDEDEAGRIAGLIAAALGKTDAPLASPVFDKELKRYRPLRAGDCAVLYRATTKAHLYESALRARGIPCRRDEARGFFARPEVADAVALLRYLALPSDLPSLLQVLRSPIGRVADHAMLQALHETRQHAASRTAVTESLGRHRCHQVLRALLDDPAGTPAILLNLATKAGWSLPHALLTEAFAALNAFAAYEAVATPMEGALARRNLCRLLELVMELEDQGATSLAALVARLSRLSKDDETGNAAADGDAVSLMTVHKSKGLEFPLVVLADAGRPWGQTDPFWAAGNAGDEGPGVFYIGSRDDRPKDDARFDALRANVERTISDECQRLLYVALTRSRQYLYITGHETARTGGMRDTTMHVCMLEVMETGAGSHGRVTEALESPVFGRYLAWNAVPEDVVIPAEEPKAPPVERPPLTRGSPAVPHEITIVSPSKHGAPRGGAWSGVHVDGSLNREDASLLGQLVHLGLDAAVKGKAFDAAAAWAGLAGAGLLAPSANRAFMLAVAQLAAATSAPAWRDLLQSATRIEAELPVVHLRDDRQMVMGTIDLLVEDAEGRRKVIDHKTTVFHLGAGIPTEPQLVAHALERGYDEQLRAYAQAVEAMGGGGGPVEMWVHFTAVGMMVRLQG